MNGSKLHSLAGPTATTAALVLLIQFHWSFPAGLAHANAASTAPAWTLAQAEPAPPLRPPPSRPKNSWEPAHGDRVVLLGDTLIERELTYGVLETRLTSAWPDRHVTYRNLGWSADTPAGQSRASFDWNKPESGWLARLLAEVEAAQPNAVILGYGMANSFDGEAGLATFRERIHRLIDGIINQAKGRVVRFVLLGPVRHEKLGPPFPDPTPHNASLQRYNDTLREIASERGFAFVDPFTKLGDGKQSREKRAFTDNGIHLNAYGYSRLADLFELTLGWPSHAMRIGITSDHQLRPGSSGAEITELQKRGNALSFRLRPERLPLLLRVEPREAEFHSTDPGGFLQADGLIAGLHSLQIDGDDFLTLDANRWRQGARISDSPYLEQVEALRRAILWKNELFFHRWRPQNQTYLFGFRKYEQGQNAREIPQFDPIILSAEQEIQKLRAPKAYRVDLVAREKPADRPRRTRFPSAAADPGTAGRKQPDSQPAASSTQDHPRFDAAPELEVSLWAENPMLAKPIQINFDPKGRLWVASSSVYPQVEPGAKADDKILILEDANGDGRAEKSTVFAEGLLIPTGVEPGDGGCYVGQSTELLHFRDRNGDGRADERRVVLSGFGTEDTHHIVHTLRWGYDGALYMNQSIYIHTHTETPHGVVRLNSGGVLRLQPANQAFEVFLRGFCNPWGHHFDEFGQSFVTDGAGGQGVCYGLPGAMYFTYAGARRICNSISPGDHPKFCGLEMIHSEHFPPDWQGSVVTSDFRANRVTRFAISEQGSAFAARHMPDLLRTTNVTFRPIDVKLGPDGALYIADWANPIINHGEVDFRDPRRDHVHGRIWRVAMKGRPLTPKTDFTKITNLDLLGFLVSSNSYARHQARRVLIERGPKILPDLKAWTLTQTAERARLEALWLHQALDAVEPQLLGDLLRAKDGRVRAAAVRVLSHWRERLPNAAAALAALPTDDHPRVRIEAIRALGEIQTAEAAEQTLAILDRPMDPFLDYAVWLTINDLARPWTADLRDDLAKWLPREHQLEFGLRAIEPQLAAPVLSQILELRPLDAEGKGRWIELIGSAGGARDLQRIYDQALAQGFAAPATERVLVALADTSRLRGLMPAENRPRLGSFFEALTPGVRLAAVRLAGAWRLATAVESLLTIVRANNTAADLRSAAFASLREIGGRPTVDALRQLAGPGTSREIRQSAALTLLALDPQNAAPAVATVLLDTRDEGAALPLWRSALDVKGAGSALAGALPRSGIHEATARAGMRAAREGGRKERALVVALAEGAGLPVPDQEFSRWEFLDLARRSLADGDPSRGEAVYRQAALACTTCHAIGGAGGKVGPDLTSIGASAPLDYIVESTLDPNRTTKEGYHSIVVQTQDGEDVTGVLVRETAELLVLRIATNEEVAIPKGKIKSRAFGTSIMPSGLLDRLGTRERLDLFRFLAELGKPGPFDASRQTVARFWRVQGHATEAAPGAAEVTTNAPRWPALLTKVDGTWSPRDAAAAAATTTLDAVTRLALTAPARLSLRLEAPPDRRVWVGGRELPQSNELVVELPKGVHLIHLRLPQPAAQQTVRLETSEGVFLTD